MQYLHDTNRVIKEDILRQFQALEGLRLSLSDRVKLITSDVSYRFKMPYSVIKQKVQKHFVDFIPLDTSITEVIEL